MPTGPISTGSLKVELAYCIRYNPMDVLMRKPVGTDRSVWAEKARTLPPQNVGASAII